MRDKEGLSGLGAQVQCSPQRCYLLLWRALHASVGKLGGRLVRSTQQERAALQSRWAAPGAHCSSSMCGRQRRVPLDVRHSR